MSTLPTHTLFKMQRVFSLSAGDSTLRVVGTLSPCGSWYEVPGVTKNGRKGKLIIPVEDLASAYFVDTEEQKNAVKFFSENVVPLMGVSDRRLCGLDETKEEAEQTK